MRCRGGGLTKQDRIHDLSLSPYFTFNVSFLPTVHSMRIVLLADLSHLRVKKSSRIRHCRLIEAFVLIILLTNTLDSHIVGGHSMGSVRGPAYEVPWASPPYITNSSSIPSQSKERKGQYSSRDSIPPQETSSGVPVG